MAILAIDDFLAHQLFLVLLAGLFFTAQVAFKLTTSTQQGGEHSNHCNQHNQLFINSVSFLCIFIYEW